MIRDPQIWIKMEIENGGGFVVVVEPTQSLNAGVGEFVEIDVEIDFVNGSVGLLGWLIYCLGFN